MSLRVKYYAGLSVDCDPPTVERIHELVRSHLAIDHSKPTEPVRYVSIQMSDEFMPQRPRPNWILIASWVIAMVTGGVIMFAVLFAGVVKWTAWLSAWFG
jgi:hypothetical protein